MVQSKPASKGVVDVQQKIHVFHKKNPNDAPGVSPHVPNSGDTMNLNI